MTDRRMLHTTTLLRDGRVLVVGGTSHTGNLDTTEMYDPATGVWSPAGMMSKARAQHTATLLADGRVLVVGGNDTSTEIYDVANGSWYSSGP